jgi:hypothetical protein
MFIIMMFRPALLGGHNLFLLLPVKDTKK